MDTIMLEIDEVEKEDISQLLQDKDILSLSKLELEEGIISGISGIIGSDNSSNNSTNFDSKKPRSRSNPVTVLKNYLPDDDDNNYHSEDENLITLTDNIRLKDISVFKKLEYKDVEYKIDKAYFDINHKYSSALDILASYLKVKKSFIWDLNFIADRS